MNLLLPRNPLIPLLFAATLPSSLLAQGQVAQPQNLLQVNTTLDTVDALPGDGICADADGNCSLRAAIQEANATPGVTRIRLDAGQTYALTLAGAGEDAAATGDLDVTSSILIRGRDATIDAGGLDRIFDVHAGAMLRIHRAHLSDGSVTNESGGGLRSAGFVRLSRSSVTNCVAQGPGASGGALFNSGGDMLVLRTTLSTSSAVRAGGAIEANAGYTLVRHSVLTGNMTGPGPGNGGAFHLTGAGIVDVEHSSITHNLAAREGGGLWNSAVGEMNVLACEISGNSALGTAADDGGGGLFNDGGTLFVEACDISYNQARMGSGSGGGLFNLGGLMTVRFCDISGNESNRAGGGIEAVAGETNLWHCDLIGNSTGASPGNGGGLHLTGDGLVDVHQSNIRHNQAAAEGGGLWNSAVGTMQVSDCVLTGNSAEGNDADQGGGALFNDGGLMQVTESHLSGNVATGTSGSGGAVLNNLGVLEMQHVVMIGNESTRAGGAVEAKDGQTTLNGIWMSSNGTGSSPGNGGGLHLTGAGTVLIDRAVILLNGASSEGGGLWNSASGTMVATRTLAFFNQAPAGRNVFNDGGSFTLNGLQVPNSN